MYLSIDLGGTNTRIAFTEDFSGINKDFEFTEVKFNTQKTFQAQVDLMLSSIVETSSDTDSMIKGICVGIPGYVDTKNKVYRRTPNALVLGERNFSELFNNKFSEELIYGENDAALAALAEASIGAGEPYDKVAYLTLSTGVGGMLISDKKLDNSPKHAEPGHMIIEKGGNYLETCGQYGCLESYVSGTSFEKIYCVPPQQCVDQKIWDTYATDLAAGIINILAMWDPDVIVIGGGMSNKFDDFFARPLNDELKKQNYFEIPPIIKSSLGDRSGLIGGFILLEQTIR